MKKFFHRILRGLIYVFAAIGLIFTAVFFGMKFGLFNVRGSIATRNQFFTIGKQENTVTTLPCSDSQTVCDWNQTPEWQAIKGGLQKDAPLIARVSTETGVPARMIAAVVVPEQTRFFTANREIFKSYFEPLKILGSLTQFSLGISGIKQETATAVEKNAADVTSPFYPGPSVASLFTYPEGANHDAELYNRLTDTKDHYYQYLYTGLYLKEVATEWARAGFDVTRKPEVAVTLFNLGFQASRPNPIPRVAGAPILTGGKIYSYGELGSAFYHSNELTDIFPQ